MKKLTILFTAISFAFLFQGCSFDEMSKNPYALYEAPAESFVQPILFKTEYYLCSVFRSTTAHLMQYAVSTSSEVTSRIVANYNIPEGTSDDVWTRLYIQYGNAVKMYEVAVKEDSKSMQAVALILRSMLMMTITDTYGNVPCTDAGLISLEGADSKKYTTRYDTQKSIYQKIIINLEEANELLSQSEKTRFSELCDKTFGGDLDKWRRFGNSLYARALLRIAMKVIEEDGGLFVLDDDKWEAVDVKNKLAELYNCFITGGGEYPMMRGREDCARVPFDKDNEVAQTPFYSITSGNWNNCAACDVLVRRMLDTTERVDSDGQVYYAYRSSANGGHQEDPRYDAYWKKTNGAPTQMLSAASSRFFASTDHKSSSGNSLIGRMPDGNLVSGITGKVYDLKNAPFYSLMNYSEICFIFAEAGARGWIPAAAGLGTYLALFKDGITESILEWNPYVNYDSPEVIEFVNHVSNGELFSGATFFSGNAVEAILTQKWVSMYFVGVESWADYRRTGYPLLKTNGPAASNKGILPTRLRYPSDEAYRNVEYYKEALDSWLDGTNNIQTDVWWADTKESRETRLLGRQ